MEIIPDLQKSYTLENDYAMTHKGSEKGRDSLNEQMKKLRKIPPSSPPHLLEIWRTLASPFPSWMSKPAPNRASSHCVEAVQGMRGGGAAAGPVEVCVYRDYRLHLWLCSALG